MQSLNPFAARRSRRWTSPIGRPTCEVSRRSSSPSRRSGRQRPSGKSCVGEAVPLAFTPFRQRA